MKRSAALLVSVLFSIFWNNSPATAQEIKLKAANYLPPTHKMSLLTGWYCDEVKKRTNGKVEITYHAGGTLLGPDKMYVGVSTGVADMGLSHTAYTRGRFTVTEALDLPLGFPSGYVATQVSNDFYSKFKPKEWEGVQPLYFATSGPLIPLLVSKPVKSLEELAGLKIRATGQQADIVKTLGAVPVPMGMPDVYDALRRGVIDGVTVDLSTLKYWKFAEVIKYVTGSWQIGSGYTFYFVMNKNKWNGMPPDVQKVLTEVAFEAKEKQAALWNEMDIEGRDTFKTAGGQLFDVSDAEAAKWVAKVGPVMAAYKTNMASKGFNEADVDGWIKYIKERIGHWRGEEKKRGIAAPF
jgi:TRAP-type C4-dicarboxylate transport system substrate-binding protein